MLARARAWWLREHRGRAGATGESTTMPRRSNSRQLARTCGRRATKTHVRCFQHRPRWRSQRLGLSPQASAVGLCSSRARTPAHHTPSHRPRFEPGRHPPFAARIPIPSGPSPVENPLRSRFRSRTPGASNPPARAGRHYRAVGLYHRVYRNDMGQAPRPRRVQCSCGQDRRVSPRPGRRPSYLHWSSLHGLATVPARVQRQRQRRAAASVLGTPGHC